MIDGGKEGTIIGPKRNELINNSDGLNLWQPRTWRGMLAQQQPLWESVEDLESVTAQLRGLPGLVGAEEIESLKHLLGEAASGRRFILQGGDCAERFQDCREDIIRSKLQILMRMALVMGFAGRRPIVAIGRMAGQYAKPRSVEFEPTSSGGAIPIFRGESIHSFDRSAAARRPDPSRLLKAYHTSSATLNFIRLLMSTGFGDLHNIDQWSLTGTVKGAFSARYEQITRALSDALSYISSCSESTSQSAKRLTGVKDFYVSHEALVLPYEESMTRFVPHMGRYYNLSTHMVWIGDRTRDINGAHVEYCRGIGNPVGIKVAADSNIQEVLAVAAKINPHNEDGKVTVITRLGSEHVERFLPDLVRAAVAAGVNVTWSVDPMHGNTVRSIEGLKTRRFEQIASEVRDSFDIHRQLGTVLGGIHLEMTGDDVTECTGGSAAISDDMLCQRYETWCDPRLNGYQSLELAFIVASYLRLQHQHGLN